MHTFYPCIALSTQNTLCSVSYTLPPKPRLSFLLFHMLCPPNTSLFPLMFPSRGSKGFSLPTQCTIKGGAAPSADPLAHRGLHRPLNRGPAC